MGQRRGLLGARLKGRGLLPGRRGACTYLYKSLLTSQTAWADLAVGGINRQPPLPFDLLPCLGKAQTRHQEGNFLHGKDRL